MKKILVVFFLLIAFPTLMMAQKHAPRPVSVPVQPGIYPEGSTRLLRFSDVDGLTPWDLKVMRNEIFARHGYIFKTKEMSDYFGQQRWYKPLYSDVSSLLSVIEKKNIDFIKQYE
jgi:hypothetical protein